MEITPKNNSIPIDTYASQINEKNKNDPASEKTTKTAIKTDTVEISETARKIQEARKQLDSIPDVRAEKVAQLRDQIGTGTYEIKPEEIAEKMLKESLFNDLL